MAAGCGLVVVLALVASEGVLTARIGVEGGLGLPGKGGLHGVTSLWGRKGRGPAPLGPGSGVINGVLLGQEAGHHGVGIEIDAGPGQDRPYRLAAPMKPAPPITNTAKPLPPGRTTKRPASHIAGVTTPHPVSWLAPCPGVLDAWGSPRRTVSGEGAAGLRCGRQGSTG